MSLAINDLAFNKTVFPAYTGYSDDQFMARVILPEVRVKTLESKIAVFTSDHKRLIPSETRGNAKAAQVDVGMSWTDLEATEHFKGLRLSAQQIDQFPSVISAAQFAMEAVKESHLIEEEYALADDMVDDGTNFSDSNRDTPGTAWNASGADIVNDINTAKAQIKTNVGVAPTDMMVTYDTYLTIADYARASLGGNADYGMPSNEQLAKYFGVRRFHIATVSYVSSVEGQTNDLDDIWGTQNCWLWYRPPTPKALKPAFGYTVLVNGKPYTYAEQDVEKNPPGVNYLVHATYQSKVLSYKAGYYWYDCLGG